MPVARQLDLACLPIAVPAKAAALFPGAGVGGHSTVAEMLAATDTDGFLVLQRGQIVHEGYSCCTARTKQLGMSMGKMLTSMLVGDDTAGQGASRCRCADH